MPNDQHLRILKQGVYTWNRWREDDGSLKPDISGVDLPGVNLAGAQLRDVNFRKTNLEGSNLRGAFCPKADFWNANLKNADLSNADFILAEFGGANLQYADFSGSCLLKADLLGADLSYANLTNTQLDHANLSGTILHWANLSNADLYSANLMDADLRRAKLNQTKLALTNMLRTDLRGTVLSGCYVHGASVWKVKVDENTVQTDLIITDPSEPTIAIDDLEVAQFLYLLLNHEKLRNAINSITRKGVLLLGRFGGGGLDVLQAVAAELRQMKYLPIIFNFDRPESRSITETVQTLVGISRFVIVDLSGPSVPQELYATVPHFKIPFVPIIESGRKIYAMSGDILEFPWVISPVIEFSSKEQLVEFIPIKIVAPAEKMVEERQTRLRN